MKMIRTTKLFAINQLFCEDPYINILIKICRREPTVETFALKLVL